MRWKTTNLHLQKGIKYAVYLDSALFFRYTVSKIKFVNMKKTLSPVQKY